MVIAINSSLIPEILDKKEKMSEAYQRWNHGVKSYESARASLQKLNGFLRGDYASIINVPLWCIGIE